MSSISKDLPILSWTNSTKVLVIIDINKTEKTFFDFKYDEINKPKGINITIFPKTFILNSLVPNLYLVISVNGFKLIPWYGLVSVAVNSSNSKRIYITNIKPNTSL